MFDWKQPFTLAPYFQHIVKRKCHPQWTMKRTSCDHHNFTFIESGMGCITIEGKEIVLKRGVLIYMEEGLEREVISSIDQPLELFGVNFSYSVATYQEEGWIHTEPPLPFNTYQEIQDSITFDRLVNLFNELTTAWIGVQPDKHFRCQIAFMEMIKLLMEWQDNKLSLLPPQTKKVQIIIDYMASHLEEKISLRQLSENFAISESHIDYLFRRTTGQSPIHYLTHMRINKAKQLLAEAYSVTQTACLTGFQDIYYFSRYFKKITGYSPSAYRIK